MDERFKPLLTAHAYRRFCEDFAAVDFNTCAALVLRPKVRTWASWGANRIRIPKDDMIIVLREGAITSVRRMSARPDRPTVQPSKSQKPEAQREFI